MMDRDRIVESFSAICLSDAALNRIEIRIADEAIHFFLDCATILDSKTSQVVDSLHAVELVLHGAKKMWYERMVTYELRYMVIDASAEIRAEVDGVAFVFTLSGGHDPDCFLADFCVAAENFSLVGFHGSGALKEYP